ncbi:hypothetical protein [Streptomyces sp. NPDC004685]
MTVAVDLADGGGLAEGEVAGAADQLIGATLAEALAGAVTDMYATGVGADVVGGGGDDVAGVCAGET